MQATSARFASLTDILLSLGTDSVVSAERILALPIHRRSAAIKLEVAAAKRLALRIAASREKAARQEFDSIVLPKRVKPVSPAAADHTLRLSSSSHDSSTMQTFLAQGGSITVLSTRTSLGFSVGRKIKIRAGSGVTSAQKSHRAHSKVARTISGFSR